MARAPVVVVGRDYVLDEVLESIAAGLEKAGCCVIRAEAPPPHQPLQFPIEQWPRLFGKADVLLISVRTRCPRALLLAAPRLRGIVFPTIGTEAVDLADAQELGLIIGYGPTRENFLGAAEATVLLIIALLLDLPGKERILRRDLPRQPFNQMKARLVGGQTIGLVGFGRVGRAVAERLSGWNTRIIAVDPYVDPAVMPSGIELVSLATLLAESDVVSVHITLSKETRNLIGAAEIAQMKPTAYLVNTARGGAVDDRALLEALQSGRLAGAALDVFSDEPLPADSPLRRLDNVILTSHMIGHVRDMHESFVATGLENVHRILRGEPPLHVRNPEALARWRERIALLG
jgi:D-3-phosphoglycerate dehydrogenase